jgi:hypothetical protein
VAVVGWRVELAVGVVVVVVVESRWPLACVLVVEWVGGVDWRWLGVVIVE